MINWTMTQFDSDVVCGIDGMIKPVTDVGSVACFIGALKCDWRM